MNENRDTALSGTVFRDVPERGYYIAWLFRGSERIGTGRATSVEVAKRFAKMNAGLSTRTRVRWAP